MGCLGLMMVLLMFFMFLDHLKNEMMHLIKLLQQRVLISAVLSICCRFASKKQNQTKHIPGDRLGLSHGAMRCCVSGFTHSPVPAAPLGWRRPPAPARYWSGRARAPAASAGWTAAGGTLGSCSPARARHKVKVPTRKKLLRR